LADRLFSLVALCIAGSILAHSSTDVLVARWFEPPRQGSEESVRSDPGP
jgi:hypothetical protein